VQLNKWIDHQGIFFYDVNNESALEMVKGSISDLGWG
jgi:hypothetical protein